MNETRLHGLWAERNNSNNDDVFELWLCFRDSLNSCTVKDFNSSNEVSRYVSRSSTSLRPAG